MTNKWNKSINNLNRTGNTGWDFLSDYCEGADLLKLAMDRYKEVNKGE